jgi:glycosyltransferase involved in cell wall biosynthesis
VQIATSRFVARATSTPSTVIYNGVRTSEQSAPREQTVVMLQRLEAEKDTATALRAWAESALGEDGWRLVIYGTGTEEAALRALAHDLRLADSVEFAGFTGDARAALRRAGIMLTTAVADAFGLAVVEAMAEATPVVATRAGAHPETLGDDGAYFATGDATDCAAQLVRLASSAAERQAVGDRLRTRQRECFSVAAHVDRLECEYRAVAAAGRDRGRA